MKGRIFYIIGGVIVLIYGIIRIVHILKPDPVNGDLIDYVNNKLIPAEKLKMQALDSYNNVVGTHYTDDQRMSDTIRNTVIPVYTKFEDMLKGLKPATKEVADLNTRYTAIADTEFSGFTQILSALEKEDSQAITEGSRRISESDKEMTAWDKSLDSLAEKHDVEITRKKPK